MKIDKTGFTLVELIVVVTILVILATIGFISYESYLVDTRDSKRLSQMNNLRDGLRLYITKGNLPLPDDSIDIQSDGNVFAYQGFAGLTVLEGISFSENTYDPLDEEFYTYYLGKDRRSFQLLGYLEKDFEDSYFQDLQTGVSEQVGAVDYEIRYPKVYGKDLGVFVIQQSLEPLQVVEKYRDLGYIDIVTDSGSLLRGIVSDSQSVVGQARDMAGLVPLSTCLTLYRDRGFIKNGVYTINPTGDKPILVYCDMDEDGLGHGGGWTFTTFIGTTGIARGAWDGTSSTSYRYDRSGIGDSYGIDLKSIYHTEAYMIVDDPDLNIFDIDEKKVTNFKYDYRKPMLDPDIHFSQKPTSSMRWGFDGEFVLNHTDGGTNDVNNQGYVNLFTSLSPRKWQGFNWGGGGVQIAPEADRQDSIFYDESVNINEFNIPVRKGWYYVR